ncbi:MAG: hypothetical protein ABIQ74_06515 [Chitinophagales bacterium]
MKYLILLPLLFSQGAFSQANDPASFRLDSVTVLILQDSTTLVGYITNENDTAMIFAIYYYGPEMIDKSKIISRENKLKSDVDLSASTVVKQRDDNSKSPSLWPAGVIAAINPWGLASAERLPASKHTDARVLLKRAHRIWITGVKDSSVVIPRKSFLYSTTAGNINIIDAKDTGKKLIDIPVSAINTIATRKYYSMAEWFAFWFGLGDLGYVGAFIGMPVMLPISIVGSLKKHYHINGNEESYKKIRNSLNKRSIAQ